MISFDFQSVDIAYVGALQHVPVSVIRYGSARVVNSSSQPVEVIPVVRGQGLLSLKDALLIPPVVSDCSSLRSGVL